MHDVESRAVEKYFFFWCNEKGKDHDRQFLIKESLIHANIFSNTDKLLITKVSIQDTVYVIGRFVRLIFLFRVKKSYFSKLFKLP